MAKPGTRAWDEAIWAAGAAGKCPDWADVLWYGVDRLGCIAMFTSGGPGPIPRCVFRDLDHYNRLSQALRSLPVIGKAEILIRYPHTNEWKKGATQGLYAFNFDYDSGRPEGYRLIARPTMPLLSTDLPAEVQTELASACLTKESFASIAGRLVDLSGVAGGLVG